MEDLWKMQKLDFRLTDVSDRAEFDALRKRFRAEEERTHSQRLLYDGHRLRGPAKPDRR